MNIFFKAPDEAVAMGTSTRRLENRFKTGSVLKGIDKHPPWINKTGNVKEDALELSERYRISQKCA